MYKIYEQVNASKLSYRHSRKVATYRCNLHKRVDKIYIIVAQFMQDISIFFFRTSVSHLTLGVKTVY